MSEKVENVIKKLPPELQSIAEDYVGLLEHMASSQIEAMLRYALDNNWQLAYETLVLSMTPAQRNAESSRIANAINAQTQKEIEIAKQQRMFVSELIRIGLLSLKAAI